MKRHFYNNEHYVLDETSKSVKLLPKFHELLLSKKLWNKFGFKKIGGSSIGQVLNVDAFSSPFESFCRIAWIGLPILDRKYVDAGIAIEPKVINLIKNVSKKKVETYSAEEYNYDYFADKDDVVGGLPDGFIAETETIIEIKTTGEKNYDKWGKYGVPVSYLKQAQLYAYLMGVPNFSIVATFLKEEDYLNPENYPIEERITKNWNFKVDLNQAKDEISKVKAWYYEVTKKGTSPTYTTSVNKDLIDWLRVSSKEEMANLEARWISEGKLKI